MTGDRTEDRATVDAGDLNLGPSEGQLHLVVIGDEMVATYPLPARGKITILSKTPVTADSRNWTSTK